MEHMPDQIHPRGIGTVDKNGKVNMTKLLSYDVFPNNKNMKLKDLKEWVNSLPKEFLEFEVVSAEKGKIDDIIRMQKLADLNETKDTSDLTYRLDKPVIEFDVDENSKEILFINKNENE
jgi:hypothetical protein